MVAVLGAVLTITSCNVPLFSPTAVAVTNQTPSRPTGSMVEVEYAHAVAPPARTGHPRLFFGVDEIPGLQSRAATTHQEIWAPIRDYVDSELGRSPPASASPDWDMLTYRAYGDQLIALAFACIISDQADVCHLATTHLLAYAAWDHWDEGDRRELGLAHMLLGNAIAYDWLYDTLSPTERETVRQSLAGWAQKLYEASSAESYESEWNNWWGRSYLQNHYATLHSALGMAGLTLMGEDDRAQTWLDQATNKLSRWQSFMDGTGDGSWHEGIHYQNYMLTMTLPFLVNLRDLQGIDLLPYSYLRAYPYWRLYNYLPDSTESVLSYGNFDLSWANSFRAQNILRLAASEFDNGYAEWLAQQLIAADGRHTNVWSAPWYVLEFLCYDATIQAQPPTRLAFTRLLPDLEGVVWRTGWGASDMIFGLKTGAYGGRFAFDTFTREAAPWQPPCVDTGCQLNVGHDHDDSNGFYIYRSGLWLAPETVGVGKSETGLHNTLLIDGQGQYRPSDWRAPEAFRGSDGLLEATTNTSGFDYVAADATRRYKNIDGVEDITRHVLFVRPDYFFMLDNLTADAVHDYEWVSHFGESVSTEGRWVRGDAGDGQVLGVGVVSPQSFETTIGDDGQPYVRVRPASPAEDLRLINILYPTDEAAWDKRPTATLLEDTGEAVAVRVQMNNGGQRSDEIVLRYAPQASASKVGPYKYDGQVAVVTRATDNSLRKLFVYGGTFLTDYADAEGRVLVTNLDKNGPFEAAYFDQSVAVSGPLRTQVTLYAPQARFLTVNGAAWPFTPSGDYITFEGKTNY